MNFKWCLFRSEREQLVWIITWDCIVLSSACETVFWSLHMAKMAVNSVRMFLWVNWPLTVICLCTSHTVTVTYKHTHSSTRIPETSEDEPIGWFEVEEDWNDVDIKLQQCRVSKVWILSFFNSLHLTPIENQKHINRGCGNTQLTVNNKILTVKI